MPDVRVRIGFADDATDEEIDEYTRDLLVRLEALDIDRVDPEPAHPAEPGTRAADPATLAGAVLLAGFAARSVLPRIIGLAEEWLRTRAQKSVTLESEGVSLTVQGHVPRRELEADVEAFIAALDRRQASGPPDSGQGSGEAEA